MTNKKHKHKHSQHRHQSPPRVQIDQEDLLKQCLQLHELLKQRTVKLRKLETGQTCYILSTKWLKEWKDFVGYEATVSEDEKIEKKAYGKRHPGKINTDIAANTYETKDFYSLPPEMKEYDYLNQIINEKKYKDDDYIAVTADIWHTFIQYYEGIQIKRPVRQLKGSMFYDSEPLRCDTIFVNLQDEELEERIKKSSKKLYDSIFPTSKMQLATIWNYNEMFKFFQQYCKHTYGHDKIRIWKGYGYMATNPIAVGIVESIKDKKYQIKGRLISSQRYQDYDIDQYIKNTHTLIVQIGQALTSEKEEGEPKGYCEECVQKKPLVISCVCHEVDYCSDRCRIDDQAFHYKTCSEAFDSESDEQYELKYSKQLPKAGLDNLGNTCYMNSVLQSLFSLDHFRTFFSSNDYLKDLNQKQLKQNNCLMLRKLSKSIKLLIQEEKSLSPWALKGQINYNLSPFRGYSQHDANDFFINFLNTVNDYLAKGDKAYHRILESLIGQFHSIVICPLCNVKSQNNQIFMQISIPIKSKVKTQSYSYCIIDSPNKNIKGRANLFDTWEQIKKNLNIGPQTLVFLNREPQGLVLIDEEQKTPAQAVKGMKGDLVFYKNIKSVEGQYMFACSLVTSKTISGMKMKSSYGTYTLISINDIQTTLGTLWLRIIQAYFFNQPQVIAEAVKMENQYFAEITEAVKLDNEAQEKNTKEEKQGKGQWEQMESQACKKIVQHYNQKLKAYAEKIGIEVYVNHFKRNRNLCAFCNKRCQNCDLPIIFDKSFEDFFDKRYQEIKFEVKLGQTLQIQSIQKDLSSSGEPTIHDCLALFNQPEQLDEQNAWYCSNCDNMALAFKQLEVKIFPPILIIHLNRFKNAEGKKMKNSEPIMYEEYQQFGKQKYRLISVVIHQGSMDAGHYWSICLRGDSYYIFNDAKVSQTQKIYNKNAYILIYANVTFIS